MRLKAALQGNLAELMEEHYSDGAKAVTLGIRSATDGLKLEMRSQVRSAGLSSRLANTWRGDTFPKSKTSINAAEVEVIVQALTPAERDSLLDVLIEQIGTILKADTTLSGTVDYCYPKAPEFLEEVIEGALAMKAAIIPVVLEYASETSLN